MSKPDRDEVEMLLQRADEQRRKIRRLQTELELLDQRIGRTRTLRLKERRRASRNK